VQAEIDGRLLDEIRRLAAEQGRPERELLDEAVLGYLRDQVLRAESLSEFFARVERWREAQGVEPLPEDEAMRLAVEEQHAWRRERAGERP
jgi:hypothetical protein